MIENAIIKIGTLLALGFGDAGSEIIAQNMANAGDVDPMQNDKFHDENERHLVLKLKKKEIKDQMHKILILVNILKTVMLFRWY